MSSVQLLASAFPSLQNHAVYFEMCVPRHLSTNYLLIVTSVGSRGLLLHSGVEDA